MERRRQFLERPTKATPRDSWVDDRVQHLRVIEEPVLIGDRHADNENRGDEEYNVGKRRTTKTPALIMYAIPATKRKGTENFPKEGVGVTILIVYAFICRKSLRDAN